MKHRLISILALSFVACAALLYGQQVDPVDDQGISSQLAKEGGSLIDKNQNVPVSDLVKGLNRSETQLNLPSPRTGSMNSSDIYAKSKPGVLVIASIYKCTKCSNWHSNCAGGFVLTGDGKAVTNYHVVNQPTNPALVAMTGDGHVYAVKEVLAASRPDDVAIVQLDIPTSTVLQPLPVAPAAQPGNHIQLISHPDSHFYTLTDGIVSRYAKRAGSTWLCITADYAKGSSGCPVLNDKGQVVGIVANTESIYYTEENGNQKNLQMVIHNCVPSANILKLIRKP